MNTENNFNSIVKGINWRKTEGLIFFTFLLAYASYIMFLCHKISIWGDEDCSLHTSSGNLFNALNLSYKFEGQPPAYFLLLTLWRKINDGIFFARLLSVLFTFLSAVVLSKLLKLLFESIYSKWVIVLFLLNPFTVWVSIQIRLYSLVIFLTFLIIYFFYKIFFKNEKSYSILFIIVGTIGIYTQYFFVFVIISLSVLLLVSKGWRAFFNLILLSIPIAFLCLPNFIFIQDQLNMHQNNRIKFSFNDRLTSIITTPQNFLINIKETPLGRIGRWFARLFWGSIFILSFFRLYNLKNENNNLKHLLEISIPAITLTIIFLLVFYFSTLFYTDRYMAIAFPFYSLLYIAISVNRAALKNSIYGILGLYFSIFLIKNYQYPFIIDIDQRSLAKYVQVIEHADEPILFHNKVLVLGFQQYYKGINTLVPLPELIFDYDFYRNDLKDTLHLEQLLKQNIQNKESSLFVTGNDLGFTEKEKVSNSILDTYLNNNFIISIDTTFKGKNAPDNLRIRRLNIKPE